MKASNASSAATLVSAIQISCSARRLLAFRQLGEHVRGLVHPAALLARFRPDLTGRLPEPECAIGDDELRGHVEPAPLEIEQQIAPVLRVLAGTIGESDQFLAAFRRRADQHEDALFFVFEPRFEMDAISPDVDVALGRQIALLPRGVLVEPAVLQSADGGCRQSGSILAKQRRQRLGEVASRNPLQVKDRQQRLDRLRAAHVGRQDRRREPDAARIGSRRLAIAYTRLADGDRTDTGHHLALRQVAVADDALVAVLGLQIGMLAEKVCDLGFDRLGEKGTCPVAQDFCELIVEDSWLNQLDDVIVGHGISLLRWRSGGVKHPHDMPPSRFPPSPTLGDSSSENFGSPIPKNGKQPSPLPQMSAQAAFALSRWWVDQQGGCKKACGKRLALAVQAVKQTSFA